MQSINVNLALMRRKLASSVQDARQSFAQSVEQVRTTPLSAYQADFAAGLAVVGILVPEAVAYAGIAHMPPLAGLIALFFGLLAYMVIGTSPYAIVSATSSSAMVLAVAVSTLSAVQINAHPETLAAVLVMMVGFWFILARILNFGQAANFVAKPVLRGVTMGLSLTIIIMQLPKLLGMHILTRNPIERVIAIVQEIPSINSVIASYFLPLEGWGVELVGNIELQPSALSIESLYDADWIGAIQMSAALCLMVYAESYSSIHSTAARHGLHPNSNRDLVALGTANLLSGFFGGLSVGAGFSATSLNEQAGAKSRLAGAVALALFVLIVIFLMPFITARPPWPTSSRKRPTGSCASSTARTAMSTSSSSMTRPPPRA